MAGDRKLLKGAKALIKEVKRGLKKRGGELSEELRLKCDKELEALEAAVKAKNLKQVELRSGRLAELQGEHLPVKKKGTVREYAEAIIIAVVLALFIRTFVVQAFKIPSGSMENTLLVGDHILVNKFIYGVKIPLTGVRLFPITQPNRGDVVVFVYPVDPSKDFIKRVVAVPGDQVQIRGKVVYVNGEAREEGYAIFQDSHPGMGETEFRENFGPVAVPPGAFFVLGDNRDRSYDSRFWGFVKMDRVKGKAFIIYWSWNRNGPSIRWGRIGHLIR